MELDTSLISALGRSSRFLQRTLQRELAAFGIGLGEFRVVGLLMGEPEGLSQNELCDRLGVTAPSLSVAVRKLEAEGVVERRSDARDARVKRVVLRRHSDLGKVQRMLGRLEARLTESVSARDLAAARRVLLHVAEVLEAEDGP